MPRNNEASLRVSVFRELVSQARAGAHTLPNTGSASYNLTHGIMLRSPLQILRFIQETRMSQHNKSRNITTPDGRYLLRKLSIGCHSASRHCCRKLQPHCVSLSGQSSLRCASPQSGLWNRRQTERKNGSRFLFGAPNLSSRLPPVGPPSDRVRSDCRPAEQAPGTLGKHQTHIRCFYAFASHVSASSCLA